MKTADTSGGDDRFEDVFADHYMGAVRLAWLLCGDRDQAEEAVAEALANVYRRWRRGAIRDIGPYLRRAVVNQVRRSGRRRRFEHVLTRQLVPLPARPDHAPALAERAWVVAALRQLSDGQRTTVVLRYFADLSESETAATLGVSVGTVKSQTARGLSRLRVLLEDGSRETSS